MGAVKEPHDSMLHFGYGMLVCRDCSMGMVFGCISGVRRYNRTSCVDCTTAVFRIHVSIYWQIARSPALHYPWHDHSSDRVLSFIHFAYSSRAAIKGKYRGSAAIG
jgi:hypothetical protein